MSQEVSVPADRLMDPPPSSPQMNHGRTVAGWFLFWAASIGMLVVAVGAVQYNWITIGIGAAVVILAVVVSAVLRLMGHGQPRRKGTPPTVEDL